MGWCYHNHGGGCDQQHGIVTRRQAASWLLLSAPLRTLLKVWKLRRLLWPLLPGLQADFGSDTHRQQPSWAWRQRLCQRPTPPNHHPHRRRLLLQLHLAFWPDLTPCSAMLLAPAVFIMPFLLLLSRNLFLMEAIWNLNCARPVRLLG